MKASKFLFSKKVLVGRRHVCFGYWKCTIMQHFQKGLGNQARPVFRIKMSSDAEEYFVCQCFFTHNIFLKEYETHVVFESEQQFQSDYRWRLFWTIQTLLRAFDFCLAKMFTSTWVFWLSLCTFSLSFFTLFAYVFIIINSKKQIFHCQFSTPGFVQLLLNWLWRVRIIKTFVFLHCASWELIAVNRK